MTVGEERTMHAIQSLERKAPDLEQLNLRDMFAMHIMTGFCNTTDTSSVEKWNYNFLAKVAYEAADAMLEVRRK